MKNKEQTDRIKNGPGANAGIAALLIFAAAFTWGCKGKAAPEKGADAKTMAAAAAPAAGVTRADGDQSAGKAVYFKYCHFCHGQKGLGDGPVGIALSPHPADFVNDTKRMSKTDAELLKSISEGIHKQVGGEAMSMPRWQDILNEKERRDVLAFIRRLEREGKGNVKQ